MKFLNFIIWNIMDIDTRTLCLYKSIFNLTLKQIWDLCTINNQFEQHANHPQLLNFSKASWNTSIDLFSAMISYLMFLYAKTYFDLFLHTIVLIDSSLS